MAITNAFALLALDDVLVGTTFYVGLLVGSTEVSGGGYTRQSITFGAASGTPATSRNAADAVFPVATASWGAPNAYGIYTAVSGGTLLGTGTLSGGATVGINDRVTLTANTIALSLA